MKESKATIDLLKKQLIESTKKAELILIKKENEKGHDLLFNLREIILDLNRLELIVLELKEMEDESAITLHIELVTRALLYEVLPHVKNHAEEMLKILKK